MTERERAWLDFGLIIVGTSLVAVALGLAWLFEHLPGGCQ